jgi:hypothetical protein
MSKLRIERTNLTFFCSSLFLHKHKTDGELTFESPHTLQINCKLSMQVKIIIRENDTKIYENNVFMITKYSYEYISLCIETSSKSEKLFLSMHLSAQKCPVTPLFLFTIILIRMTRFSPCQSRFLDVCSIQKAIKFI